MGDYGGILTVIRYLENGTVTKSLLYSTDFGENWNPILFHDEELQIDNLISEPGENTAVFMMMGSLPQEHQWITIKVDLKNVFGYNCTKVRFSLLLYNNSILKSYM